MDVKLNRDVKKRIESRQIVKTILDFGVNENQKIDIMYFLAMTIEDNDALKEITSCLKKFKYDINNDQEDTIINNSKILT